MSTVIETLGKYETYLRSDRAVKYATLRKVNLSLSYFTELYGGTETTLLKATDMHTFYQRLKTKKSRKSKNGEVKPLGTAHLNKIMTHIKAFVKWLSDNAKLGKLVPADVPTCKVTEHRIAYLTKEEMSILMQHLELEVADANVSGNQHRIYSAYLWRAVIRMLYTA